MFYSLFYAVTKTSYKRKHLIGIMFIDSEAILTIAIVVLNIQDKVICPFLRQSLRGKLNHQRKEHGGS